MSAIRFPLLCAFAGGCLCNALVFGLWRAAESAGTAAVRQPNAPHQVAGLVTPAVASRLVEPAQQLLAPEVAGQSRAPTAAAAESAEELDAARPTAAGSAVSDVLTQLEIAYRERVAASAPAPAAPSAEAITTSAPMPGVDVRPAAPLTPVSAVAAVSEPPPAVAPAAFAVASVAPAFMMPAAPAASVPAPPVAPAPVPAALPPAMAAQDAPPPSVVHYGDVNQNTYITNVRQGDVYLIQLQQIAMLQYMQLLGMPAGVASPSRHMGRGAPQRSAPFTSGITNPDNPWGFHFSPPNLVR